MNCTRSVSASSLMIMALLVMSLQQGGKAWVVGSMNNMAAKAAASASGRLGCHTQAALRFRCGAESQTTTWSSLSRLWFPRNLRRASTLPFWAAASSSSLFQSTAATHTSSTTASDSSVKGDQQSPVAASTKILADNSDFIKPDPDLRQYRWIQLANNLQVLLVSTTETTSKDQDDPTSSGSKEAISHVEAAAVHVQAGHFDDTMPGVSKDFQSIFLSVSFCF